MSSAAEKLANLLTATLELPARSIPPQVFTAVTPEQVDLAHQISRWRRWPTLFVARGWTVLR